MTQKVRFSGNRDLYNRGFVGYRCSPGQGDRACKEEILALSKPVANKRLLDLSEKSGGWAEGRWR